MNLYEIINALTAWARGGDQSDADWADAVAADPTEPRIYEGD